MLFRLPTLIPYSTFPPREVVSDACLYYFNLNWRIMGVFVGLQSLNQYYRQFLTLPVCSCWGAPPIISRLDGVRKCPAPTEYPANQKCTIQYWNAV